MTSAPTTSDTPLTTNLPCAKCHYNLRTKRPSELCPECAHPVADSIQFQRNATSRNPRRAMLGALLLALYCFLTPVSALANYLIRHLIADIDLGYVLLDWTGLSVQSISTALLIAGILLLAANAVPNTLSRRTILLRRFILILLAFELLPTLGYWIKAASDYYTEGRMGFAMYYSWSPRLITMLPFFFYLTECLLTCLLLSLAWRFMHNLADRLHQPSLRGATSILFIAALILTPILMLLATISMIDLTLHNFPAPRLFAHSTWRDALQFLHSLAHYTNVTLMLAFTLYWLTVARLFRRIVPVPETQAVTMSS